MIANSTPWSITWAEDEIRSVTFTGEWASEPKFYLTLPKNACWDSSSTPIAEHQMHDLLTRLRCAASGRGWIIVVDDPLALLASTNKLPETRYESS